MDRRRESFEGDGQQRRKKTARRRRMQFLSCVCCLILLVAVMYGGLTLYSLYRDRAQETGSEQVNSIGLDENGNVVDGEGNVIGVISNTVVYSQEQLDEKVAEAAAAAQEQGSEEVLDAIRAALTQGDSVLEALRPLYPDHILVASGGQYHFVPIDRSLAQSTLRTENLNLLENGEIQYLENGQVISHKGVDVSKHQGAIDWNKVAGDGVEFAFIRVGNRGYGESGTLQEDGQFDTNIKGAQAAGMKVGVYLYSQALNETELREEADLVLKKIAPYHLDCPVVFDVEKVSGGGRMNQLTPEERTDLTALFCQIMEDAGYRPMIYHNTEMGALMLDLARLEDYDKWFAAYTDTLYYPYEYKVWQYSATGRVQGIQGDVDLNLCLTPLWE